jgi:protocatechuate 3,4-dioxygenase, beta subunit
MLLEPNVLIPTSPLDRLATCPEDPISRRRMLKMSLALGAVTFGTPYQVALAQQKLQPTADQILGPFYPVIKPTDGGNDLTHLSGRPGRARGQIFYVMGQVMNRKGKPVRNAKIEVWQANAAGRYLHPTDWNPAPIDVNFDGYAKLTTDDEGRYRFKTIKPGAYPVGPDWTRPPHIHFEVKGGVNRLITQMYFAGEPLNDSDKLLQSSWAKESLIAKVLPPTKEEEPEAQLAVWDIVLFTG